MRLMLTRPEPESEALAQILGSLGHEVLIEPLLSIAINRNFELHPADYQAIFITSRNGARAISTHPNACQFKTIPIFTVGAATAARLEQFNVVHTGSAGVAELVQTIRTRLKPTDGPLLYVRGRHITGDAAKDLKAAAYKVDQLVAYEAVARRSFSPKILEQFEKHHLDGVVLYSARTAEVFSTLADKAGLIEDFSDMTFYCLSKKVAENLQLENLAPNNQVEIAKLPTQLSLVNAIGNK